ncbi:hypothetical protein [Ramlibacter sp. 2FC]|uniref:hypothetical protein n=1 Tax=Ramlibacter sp. 2FC TaxID=2502188 RepID=UPI0010F51C8D|nr:hypothetical protein [Ramlibacter sp. 2FC]
MKDKHRLIVIAAASILSACAGSVRYEYEKEGASEYDRTTALSECRYQIQLNKAPDKQEAELMKLCMQGKGYRVKPVK